MIFVDNYCVKNKLDSGQSKYIEPLGLGMIVSNPIFKLKQHPLLSFIVSAHCASYA